MHVYSFRHTATAINLPGTTLGLETFAAGGKVRRRLCASHWVVIIRVHKGWRHQDTQSRASNAQVRHDQAERVTIPIVDQYADTTPSSHTSANAPRAPNLLSWPDKTRLLDIPLQCPHKERDSEAKSWDQWLLNLLTLVEASREDLKDHFDHVQAIESIGSYSLKPSSCSVGDGRERSALFYVERLVF